MKSLLDIDYSSYCKSKAYRKQTKIWLRTKYHVTKIKTMLIIRIWALFFVSNSYNNNNNNFIIFLIWSQTNNNWTKISFVEIKQISSLIFFVPFNLFQRLFVWIFLNCAHFFYTFQCWSLELDGFRWFCVYSLYTKHLWKNVIWHSNSSNKHDYQVTCLYVQYISTPSLWMLCRLMVDIDMTMTGQVIVHHIRLSIHIILIIQATIISLYGIGNCDR